MTEEEDLIKLRAISEAHPQIAQTIEEVVLSRLKQILKGYSIKNDATKNGGFQLPEAAQRLSKFKMLTEDGWTPPNGWDEKVWSDLCHRSYKNRLKISSALLMAEIDRIDYLVNNPELAGSANLSVETEDDETVKP